MAKIMLVEDDNNLREIYEARLMAEGYEIVTARDGEEALAVAVREKPDLIISDVMMPKISGFDMLDILRSTPETKNAKVIMMTALSQAEDKERASKLGADRYLVKSQVTLEDVAKVAREVLEGKPATPQASEEAPAPTPTAAPASTPVPVAAPEAAPIAAPSPHATTPVAQVAAAEPAPEPVATTPAVDLPAAQPDPAVIPPVPVEPAIVPTVAPVPPMPVDTTESDIDVATLATGSVAASVVPQGITNLGDSPAPAAVSASTASIPDNDVIKSSAEVWSSASMDTPPPAAVSESPALVAAEAKVDAAPVQSIEAEEAAIAEQIESVINTMPSSEPADTPEPAEESTPTAEEPTQVAEAESNATDAPAPATATVPTQIKVVSEEDTEAPTPAKTSAGQKVIHPISDPNASSGPSLDELAHIEAQKEAAQTTGGVVHPEAATTHTPGSSVDPNSLAL